MSKRYVACGVIVLAMSTPVFAATLYFVEHKPEDHNCEVTEHEPDGKTTVLVGDTSYASKDEAAAAMALAPECAPPVE